MVDINRRIFDQFVCRITTRLSSIALDIRVDSVNSLLRSVVHGNDTNVKRSSQYFLIKGDRDFEYNGIVGPWWYHVITWLGLESSLQDAVHFRSIFQLRRSKFT